MAGTALPSIAAIQLAVAERHGLPVELMRQPSPTMRCDANTHDIAHPRQEAMALAFLLTEHSRSNIGRYFGGRDPTTVIHACRQVEKRRRNKSEVDSRLKSITLELLSLRSILQQPEGRR